LNITIKSALMLLMAATVIWACTVQTEDDSVPGNGKGWGGLYYYYTPYTGYLVDGKHEDFVGTDDSIISHSLVAEGVVGFCKDFYAKVDVPYSYTTSTLSVVAEGQPALTTLSESVSGIGDAQLMVKWDFINSEGGPRVGVLMGALVPTGDEEQGLGYGVTAPKVQLVAGTPLWQGRLYAGASYLLIPEFEAFDTGDIVGYSLAYDWSLGKGFSIPLEVFGTLQEKNKVAGQTELASGSQMLVASPCVTYTPIAWATVCAGVIVPVLKQGYTTDYNYQPHLTFFYNF